MRILNLKIKSPEGKIIRDIDFAENGVSFIYGDIKEPENKGATINSLGKSLLIKMIDYIYGSNEDSSIMKPELENYVLEAIVKFQNIKYFIRRIIGESPVILVNEKEKTLTEYRDFFSIERSLYSKQLLTKKKASELSQNVQHPAKNDYIDFLRMLEINNLVEPVSDIYDSQDSIDDLKKSKKQIISFYGGITPKQLDEEIYFVDKEIKKLAKELEILSEKIKSIEISDVQQNIIEEYSNFSDKLKSTKKRIEAEKTEKKRLNSFIDSSNKSDIKSDHILILFERTQYELPDMVKRTIEEVEAFHDKVYEERKDYLTGKINNLDENINALENDITSVSFELDRLGKIISANQVYQDSVAIYEKYSLDLQNLKYREGELSQVKNIDDTIKKEDDKLTENFSKAKEVFSRYEQLINKYREYIDELTKKIYDSEVFSFFNVEIIKKHTKHRPVKVEIAMRGDTGEGKNEVKKNLIDYLLFEFNNLIEILIQDSACFNGIDPRQVNNMIGVVSEISARINKQAIIAVNKYQLANYTESINFIVEHSAIILSENEKLMKFDF
ncbi:MAG: DUF2326 domain-containing protein [Clostridiales bacterium]|jgi:uncharacterized protein YydD (DUF2326 family)|nr:DUF2326 domain-containing protein [Clostridiales bacterium]